MLKIRCFVVGLCLLMLMSFLAPVAVCAATVNTIQGVVGSTITVTGLSYPGQTYLIIWDSVSIDSGVAPASGTISFTVPESVGGSHTLVVQNPAGNQAYISTFTVLPSIFITPETATIGSTITVTGKGFRANETDIVILYDAESQKSAITASASGTWTSTFTAPVSVYGAHTVDAYGAITLATNVTDKTFTVKPSIAITPESGGVGTTVSVTGTGFPSDETNVIVYFDNTTVGSSLTADDNGTWSTTFTVPKTYSGNHVIDAYSNTIALTAVSDQAFAVVSGITLDKTSVYAGDVIAITGSGFTANESNIYLTFDGITQGNTISADSTGQWKVNFTVPPSINGVHTIGVSGSSSTASASKTITVLSRITINPLNGNVGDTISVFGTGFGGGKALTVTYGTIQVATNITTDTNGGFTAAFKAPKGQRGNITITATDVNSVTSSAVFSMDSSAPPVPQTMSPSRGSTVGFVGDIKVDFRWRDVTDPSGVTYDVEVADDMAFSSIRLQFSDLTVTEYKTIDSEALPQGKYYWRVRAIDGAGNASDWSAPVLFTAGYMATSTLAIIIAVLLVLLIILIRIRFAFNKK